MTDAQREPHLVWLAGMNDELGGGRRRRHGLVDFAIAGRRAAALLAGHE